MEHYVILGRPESGGSKTSWAHPKTGRIITRDANPNADAWKNTVKQQVMLERRNAPLLEGPLFLYARFYRKRSASHFTSTGSLTAKASREWSQFTMAPDATKLLRPFEDALTGMVWGDDSQIVQQFVAKSWGDRDYAFVAVCHTDGNIETAFKLLLDAANLEKTCLERASAPHRR